ncbi:MAG: hypothetical protein GY832_43525 [Chloroflexi bacterium]|nr:hypothetical protein [Chloroflexota bacterium]
MNAKNMYGSRTTWWVVGLFLLIVAGAFGWFSGQPAQAGWDVTPVPGETAACGNSGNSSPVLQPLPPENPTARNPLAGMSLDQIKDAAQTLTPEAAQVSSSVDIQFHNLHPAVTLNGATVETSVVIQSSVCVEDMWAQIVMPAQSTGEAKLAYTLKSPSTNIDRLQDWIRFPFVAVAGTATASVGIDGYAEGVYPFTWVVGYEDTVLMTQEGFFTVGACSCEGTSASSKATSAASFVRQSLPLENPTARNPLTGMSLDQIKDAAQTLTPEAKHALNSLDIQFHSLHPAVTLNGPTMKTSVTIQSDVCLADMWAQIVLPAQSTGEAKFADAFKSPSTVVDRLQDWVRFPFPAVGGTSTAGVGLDGFAEGVYPFTWVVGQGDTVLMTQDGFFSVGACSCGGACADTLAASDPLADMSLDQIKEAARNLSPEAARALGSMDIQFDNLHPAMTLGGPTAATSVTIQSDVCVNDMWTQIVLPAHSTGAAKLAHASKSPSTVVDRLQDWVRFPFPAIGGTSTASVGLDSFQEGVYPFTWIVGYGDTVLMTQDGFLAVGPCGCGSPCPVSTPTPTPTPRPTPVGECAQHSPARIDVLMGADQTVHREIEFVNACNDTQVLDLAFSDLVSQIYLAGGHDQIALAPDERQTIRLYFTTEATVPSDSTQLIVMESGTEVTQIPITIGPGAAMQPSASLAELDGINLLPGETGFFAGTIHNNSNVPLIITATIPATSSTWLMVTDSPVLADIQAFGQSSAAWDLDPKEEKTIYFTLYNATEFTGTATVYLESQYGDRQEIPIAARFGPYADLVVSGTTLPTEIASGDVMTATVTVFNPGPSDVLTVATSINVTGDALVAGVAASSDAGCKQYATVLCRTPKILAGEWITVVVRLEVPVFKAAADFKLPPLAASIQVEVWSSTYDPNPSNNSLGAIWGGLHVYLPVVAQNWSEPPPVIYLPFVIRD